MTRQVGVRMSPDQSWMQENRQSLEDWSTIFLELASKFQRFPNLELKSTFGEDGKVSLTALIATQMQCSDTSSKKLWGSGMIRTVGIFTLLTLLGAGWLAWNFL